MINRIVNLFWLWTVLGVVLAWAYPAYFTWFHGKIPGTEIPLISAGLGIIMLGMGMTLTFGDFRECLKMPRWIGIGVTAQFLIMPLAGWAIATISGLPNEFKLGIILVSCCPGGTASNVVTYLAKGSVALSVLMTTCSTLLAVWLTPLLTKVYASALLKIDATEMMFSMLGIVLIPIFGGLLLNRYLGSKLEMVKKISPLFSVFTIVLIVSAVVGATKPSIISYWKTLIPAVFTVHAIGFGLGYFWARFFKMPIKESRTISIEVGMQNSGLGASLAKTHFTMLAAAPCAISAFFHCIIGSLLASYWGRKNDHPSPQQEDAS